MKNGLSGPSAIVLNPEGEGTFNLSFRILSGKMLG